MSSPIIKDLQPTIDKMLELLNPSTFVAHLNEHHLNERPFEIKKGDGEFDFSSSSSILKGAQTHKELQFERKDIIEFKKEGQTIFIEGRYVFIDSIKYNDVPEKLFSGTIGSFSSCKDRILFNEKFLRMVIPNVKKGQFDLRDFRKRFFITPQKKSFQYIPLTIEEMSFHLYKYSIGDQEHIVIDCLNKDSLTLFQKKCFNILLTYGFITGDLIHDECFIFSYENDEMIHSENFLYHSMRASLITHQPTFTSNPFSVHGDIDFEREADHSIKKEVLDKLNTDMEPLHFDTYSKLTTMFYKEEKLQRATLLFIQSHKSSLEMRIPNYYVAIEAITGYISSKMATGAKSLNPIKDKVIAENLIKQIKEYALKIKTDNTLSNDDFNMDIIEKNILKLNAPPNADKLSESFTTIGYTLSAEQSKLLKERNTFLHGSFIKTVDDDKAFRDALHVGLRLHFMISVLILKLADFEGKIINYAELWSHITERTLGEDRLVKI